MQTVRAADKRHPVIDIGYIIVALESTRRCLAQYAVKALGRIHRAFVAGYYGAVEEYVAVLDIPHMLIGQADLYVGVAYLFIIDLCISREAECQERTSYLEVADVFERINAEVIGLSVGPRQAAPSSFYPMRSTLHSLRHTGSC